MQYRAHKTQANVIYTEKINKKIQFEKHTSASSLLLENRRCSLVFIGKMVRIAHCADIHIQGRRREEYAIVFAQFYESLRREAPDIICALGDIYDDKNHTMENGEFEDGNWGRYDKYSEAFRFFGYVPTLITI